MLMFDACVCVVRAGIKQKESYTDALSANTLWLSSIFKTETNNDRAIIDHKMLDEKFGTVDALRSLCKKFLKKGKYELWDFCGYT